MDVRGTDTRSPSPRAATHQAAQPHAHAQYPGHVEGAFQRRGDRATDGPGAQEGRGKHSEPAGGDGCTAAGENGAMLSPEGAAVPGHNDGGDATAAACASGSPPVVVGSELLRRFEVLCTLGSGAYGRVFKLRERSSGQICVLKQVVLAGVSAHDQQVTFNEAQVMSKIHHQNVIQYYESFIEHGRLNIVMEFAPGGDLGQAIAAKLARREHFSEEALWDILIGISRGLQHIHDARILHRDIKGPNIFLDANGNVKIGDFGLGRMLGPQSAFANTAVGTPLYFSPEVVEEREYNARSDMWSLGCLMYELATLRPPFLASNHLALAKKIVSEKPPPLPNRYSKQMRFLIWKLLEKDAADRPDTVQVLAYTPVLKRINTVLQHRLDSVLRHDADERAEHEGLIRGLRSQVASLTTANTELRQQLQAAVERRRQDLRDHEAALEGTLHDVRANTTAAVHRAVQAATQDYDQELTALRTQAQAQHAVVATLRQQLARQHAAAAQLAAERDAARAQCDAQAALAEARTQVPEQHPRGTTVTHDAGVQVESDTTTAASPPRHRQQHQQQQLAVWQGALQRSSTTLQRMVAHHLAHVADGGDDGSGSGSGSGSIATSGPFLRLFQQFVASMQAVDAAAAAVATSVQPQRQPHAMSPSATNTSSAGAVGVGVGVGFGGGGGGAVAGSQRLGDSVDVPLPPRVVRVPFSMGRPSSPTPLPPPAQDSPPRARTSSAATVGSTSEPAAMPAAPGVRVAPCTPPTTADGRGDGHGAGSGSPSTPSAAVHSPGAVERGSGGSSGGGDDGGGLPRHATPSELADMKRRIAQANLLMPSHGPHHLSPGMHKQGRQPRTSTAGTTGSGTTAPAGGATTTTGHGAARRSPGRVASPHTRAFVARPGIEHTRHWASPPRGSMVTHHRVQRGSQSVPADVRRHRGSRGGTPGRSAAAAAPLSVSPHTRRRRDAGTTQQPPHQHGHQHGGGRGRRLSYDQAAPPAMSPIASAEATAAATATATVTVTASVPPPPAPVPAPATASVGASPEVRRGAAGVPTSEDLLAAVARAASLAVRPPATALPPAFTAVASPVVVPSAVTPNLPHATAELPTHGSALSTAPGSTLSHITPRTLGHGGQRKRPGSGLGPARRVATLQGKAGADGDAARGAVRDALHTKERRGEPAKGVGSARSRRTKTPAATKRAHRGSGSGSGGGTSAAASASGKRHRRKHRRARPSSGGGGGSGLAKAHYLNPTKSSLARTAGTSPSDNRGGATTTSSTHGAHAGATNEAEVPQAAVRGALPRDKLQALIHRIHHHHGDGDGDGDGDASGVPGETPAVGSVAEPIDRAGVAAPQLAWQLDPVDSERADAWTETRTDATVRRALTFDEDHGGTGNYAGTGAVHDRLSLPLFRDAVLQDGHAIAVLQRPSAVSPERGPQPPVAHVGLQQWSTRLASNAPVRTLRFDDDDGASVSSGSSGVQQGSPRTQLYTAEAALYPIVA